MMHHGASLVLRKGAPFLALAMAVSACGVGEKPAGSPQPSAPASASPTTDSLLAYDASADPDFRADQPTTTDADGIRVTDVSYASAAGGRATAWLVEPPAASSGPFAGLVYLHGSETDRTDFLDEAVAMARAGAVSLVLDAPFARRGENIRPYLETYYKPEMERDMTAQAGVDVRRAFDVLSNRPNLDRERLGFIGHSWGASLGVVVASVDHRAKAWALLSPRPSWTAFLQSDDAYAVRKRKAYAKTWDAYIAAMRPLDALPVIDDVDGASLLLQYGTDDDVVPPNVAKQLIDATPDGTTTQTFGAGHALDAKATRARVDWLAERLSLTRLDDATLAKVGLPDE